MAEISSKTILMEEFYAQKKNDLYISIRNKYGIFFFFFSGPRLISFLI